MPAGQVVVSPKLVGLDTQYRVRPGICDTATRRMVDHLAPHAQTLHAGDLVLTRSATEQCSLSGEEAMTSAFFTADETPAAVE